jgi:SEC-C motif-containing protein
MSATDLCPCCSELPYTQCCGRFLEQGAYPQTAEQLMRSRYTAYTQARADYLEKTWHSSTRPRLTQAELQATQWQRLEVIAAKPGLKKSVVEFKAYYVEQGTETCLHEVSLFKKEKNRWVYLEAQ